MSRLAPHEAVSTDRTGDDALLAELRTGDDRAFELLVRTHGDRVFATVLRLVHNEADAHDVVQETFLSAFRSLDRFEGKSQLGTWLHRIAVNAALMRLRSRTRKPEIDIHELLPRFEDSGQFPEPVASFRDAADEPALREETCALVRRCIDKLPEKYRIALLLRDIEGLDNTEVSQQLGLTVNAAKIRVHRARQALRSLLEPHFGGSRA